MNPRENGPNKMAEKNENKQYFYHPVLKHTCFFGSFSMTKKYNFAMYIPCRWAQTSALQNTML